MRALREAVAGAARTQAKVLIVGETGVGKEVVARSIHAQSARHGGPLVAVNCSGVPESLLESELFGHTRGSFTGAIRDSQGLLRQAHAGTLFLDELGEMSPRMQAVLLRFTETGEIQQVGAERPTGRADVRLICATNRDLRVQIAAGLFREDLYYRVNVIQIQVPPLRDRAEDIPALVEHFLEQSAKAHSLPVPALTPDVAQLLMAYSWPGNVRELRNVAERLVLQDPGPTLTPEHLPLEIRDASGTQVTIAVAEPKSDDAARPMAVPLSPLPFASAGQPQPFAAPAQPQNFTPRLDERVRDRVAQLWDLMASGADFWTVVYPAFKARELTRTELAALIDRGLRATSGSYTALLKTFNMPPADYKRFHAFLYQQQCNLPVTAYRRRKPRRGGSDRARQVA
jgi:DNA-binding NtrC family response regulator